MGTLSKIKFLLIIIIGIVAIIFSLQRSNESNIFKYDGASYYSYLPALFIHHDLGFHFAPKLEEHSHRQIPPGSTGTGSCIPKMTMGISILILPFFLTAHLIVEIFGLNADGYSFPYMLAVYVASLFYIVVGLYTLRKQLMEYYSEKISDGVILIIALGTNLFNYAFAEPTMTHNYLFFLFVMFLILTIKWHKSPSIKNSVFLGLITGIITLIRPSDVIIIIFFLFYGITNKDATRDKINLIFKNIKFLLISLFFFILIISFQLIYWKIFGGKYFIDTYSTEHFFFDNPHILDGLFGFRKGWFIYTPVMLLIVPGIYFLLKSYKQFGKAVLIYLILTIYIIFSWWCWWYGGSFGCRSIVESYALFSLPLAESLFNLKGNTKRIILIVFIPFCILLNLFQTYQFLTGSLHYESMTWKAYCTSFGRTKIDSRYIEALKVPDTEYAILGMDERRGSISRFPYLKEIQRWKINIIASNGKYVSADFSKEGALVANRTDAKEWETFQFIRFEYDKCFFQAINNNFISSDLNWSNKLFANRPMASGWELFSIIDLGKNQCLIKDFQGNFIEYDSISGALAGATRNFSRKQIFTLVDAKN